MQDKLGQRGETVPNFTDGSFTSPRISRHLNLPKISAAFIQCQSHRYLFPQVVGDHKAPLIVLHPHISATGPPRYRFPIFQLNSAPGHYFQGPKGSNSSTSILVIVVKFIARIEIFTIRLLYWLWILSPTVEYVPNWSKAVPFKLLFGNLWALLMEEILELRTQRLEIGREGVVC